MSTTQRPRDAGPGAPLNSFGVNGELRLDPSVRGRGRLPSRRGPAFDLSAFGRAIELHDLAYQVAHYALDADIRVVDPGSPPSAPRTVRGTDEIRSWLDNADALGLEVTHLVDGGDRVAFSQRWHQRDGSAVIATSTAELTDGLITTQHTILAWARPARRPVRPNDGWTQLGHDLWTTED